MGDVNVSMAKLQSVNFSAVKFHNIVTIFINFMFFDSKRLAPISLWPAHYNNFQLLTSKIHVCTNLTVVKFGKVQFHNLILENHYFPVQDIVKHAMNCFIESH